MFLLFSFSKGYLFLVVVMFYSLHMDLDSWNGIVKVRNPVVARDRF